MSKEKLKEELHQLIESIEDEEMLSVVKEDIVAYQKAQKGFDDLSDLTVEQRAELEDSVNEDPEKDTITEEEFNTFIKGWRKKLSSKSDL